MASMIDFHCHLDLYREPERVANEAQERGVAVLSVTTTPSAYGRTKMLAEGRPAIRTALGLHPELAAERRHELSHFEQIVPSVGFVGEIGLDGSPRFASSRSAQLEVFAHILRACTEVGGRILSIHSRSATMQVLDELGRAPNSGTPVLHWFSGSSRQARIAIDRGCWFSVGAPMLATSKGRDLLAMLPAERILTESDGPFTTTNGRQTTPVDIPRAVGLLAGLWGVTAAECEQQLRDNLRTLLAQHPDLPDERTL